MNLQEFEVASHMLEGQTQVCHWVFRATAGCSQSQLRNCVHVSSHTLCICVHVSKHILLNLHHIFKITMPREFIESLQCSECRLH